MNQQANQDRRSFLRKSVIASVTAGIAPAAYAANQEDAPSKNNNILNFSGDMRYRAVGDTGVSLSVISLGGLVNEPPVNAYAIDHGVNLCHISTSYHGGESIKKLGELMKTHRDRVYIALKDNFLPHEFTSVDDDLDKFKDVLDTLNTDYIDFLMFNRHDAESARDPQIEERFEALKEKGVVRYCGLTTHGDIKGSVAAGIDFGVYNLIMPVLNQPNLELLDAEMKRAHEKGMGFMGMKTMKGQNTEEMQMAYLKKLLVNPAVATVNKGIGSFSMFDNWLETTQQALSMSEDRALYKYAQANRANNCMMCDECHRACPDNVAISTVLRCKDYYWEETRDWQTAVGTYHELPAPARISDRCRDCTICEETCPNGIKIKERLYSAHQLFA